MTLIELLKNQVWDSFIKKVCSVKWMTYHHWKGFKCSNWSQHENIAKPDNSDMFGLVSGESLDISLILCLVVLFCDRSRSNGTPEGLLAITPHRAKWQDVFFGVSWSWNLCFSWWNQYQFKCFCQKLSKAYPCRTDEVNCWVDGGPRCFRVTMRDGRTIETSAPENHNNFRFFLLHFKRIRFWTRTVIVLRTDCSPTVALLRLYNVWPVDAEILTNVHIFDRNEHNYIFFCSASWLAVNRCQSISSVRCLL